LPARLFKTEEQIREIIDMYAKEHLSMTEIARQKKCDRHVLTRLFKRLGIKPRNLCDITVKIPNDPVELGYLAGIFDGEGSIVFYKGRKRRSEYSYLAVQITNTSKELMDWLTAKIGGRIMPSSYRTRVSKNWSICYQWRLPRAKNQLIFLRAIYPYLKVKKEKAQRAISMLEAKLGIP
jgi:hypothetical protein